ncbi:hypothetical protein NPIL_546791 [Nephila pilipes]|uniref:Uncharacterized protein n=1 Tax=Nephila pilipes TaxID=299642 RepID=A0A8X6QYL9_NEPPI|nr:hypothetical protein NPIL_546791 [Nephila pilipes]
MCGKITNKSIVKDRAIQNRKDANSVQNCQDWEALHSNYLTCPFVVRKPLFYCWGGTATHNETITISRLPIRDGVCLMTSGWAVGFKDFGRKWLLGAFMDGGSIQRNGQMGATWTTQYLSRLTIVISQIIVYRH